MSTTPASPKSREWLDAVEQESNPAPASPSASEAGAASLGYDDDTTPGTPSVTSRWQTAQSAAATAGDTSRKIGEEVVAVTAGVASSAADDRRSAEGHRR